MFFRSATAATLILLFSMPVLSDQLVPNASPEISKAINRAEDLNEKCRGGSGDDPKTQSFCDKRDIAYEEIHKQGWCYGDDSGIQTESDKEWQECPGSKPPRYDAKAYCKSIASLGGTPSEIMYGACLDQEQSSYDGLKPSWMSLPPNIKKYCDGIARLAAPGSYIMLSACVQQELNARKSNSTAEFNY